MDIMAIAAEGMRGDLARLDSISHNVANVLTPGFKRQIAMPGAFDAQVAAAATGATGQARKLIDPSAGPLRYTGVPTDVAIEGDGFFELATPNGPAYTRQGSFNLDAQGRLVGSQGMPVMGEGGEIRLTNAPFTIAANGDISQDGHIAGRLKLTNFDNAAAMLASGAGMYLPGEARASLAGQVHTGRSAGVLRVGFVEGSNVSTPQEMVRLTETVRHFESLQKLVQGYDDSLEKTIRKLGDF
ncbi:MAG TPA: flagellar hook-basal body protein [Telluria sp.]|nr:flagellar hook-basal body protein [Telluria sp.]